MILRSRFGRFSAGAGGMFLLAASLALAVPPVPVITAIKPTRTNILVEIQAPVGFREITLEGRARFGRGTWEPRAVVRTDGGGGRLTVSLPPGRSMEMLRVKARPQAALPDNFYTGQTNFSGPAETEVNTYGGPMIYTSTGMGGIEVRTPTDMDTGGQPREVVESDIWKIRGATLYYFNQNRGLQIVDLQNPDAPRLRGTLSLPAVGEQMYVLNDTYAVLLVRETCESGSYQSGQVLVVNVAGSTPSPAATAPVAGRLQESRLVGTALYVSSSVYRPVTGTTNTQWEYGTMVESFDLADPARPLRRTQLWFAGQSDDVVTATDTFLFVAHRSRENFQRSVLHVVDITAPNGQMQEFASLQPAGHLKDKFKIHYHGGILTTVAEDWTPTPTNRMRTRLETWRLPDPRSAGPLGIAKLGEVILGYNESLHATRFDGTRAYVVTFFQVDPLWVVDLSDPARPRIAGELEVPGWSTYIEPLGDRLVAVGWENSRVAVSLFDVSNPAQPRLHNKILLGEYASWSEANLDEKAFTVLPQAGLILVPYGGLVSNGYAQRVQLIDLRQTNLVQRGVIEHQMQPRRATLYQNRILSLSGWELLTVDAADRDHPRVTASLELSWPVSRLWVAGSHLLQLFDRRNYYSGNPNDQPVLRVSTQADPNRVVNLLRLSAWPVVGATLRNDRLYLLQTPSDGYWWRGYAATDSPAGTDSNFKLTVIDLAALPQLQILGVYEGNHGHADYGQQWEPLWLDHGLLVWVNTQPLPYYYIMPVLWDGPITLGRFGFWPGPIYGSGGGEMVAFEVGSPTSPIKWVSSVDLSTNGWLQFSRPVAQGNCVFLSHGARAWSAPISVPSDYPVGEPVPYAWRVEQKHYLSVVDFTDPQEPVVRAPVNLPGTLIGLSHEGNILYTTGPHYTTNGLSDYRQYVDAGAYDGTQFHLVASLPLPAEAQPPRVHQGGVFYLEGKYAPDASATTLLGWRLDTQGKWQEWGRLNFNGYPEKLVPLGTWLGVQSQGNIAVVEAAATLRTVAQSRVQGCFSPALEGADGNLQTGWFVPLDAYGVLRLLPLAWSANPSAMPSPR
ncbi:MAG: beta-propeller domain-containing protein [Verrucomicrobiae bacterium]|nr:beta-propeller domain-containing protein [Verrucomicrobiae bacterium]